MARWYVFIFLNVYGLGKIVGGQFYRRGELPVDVAAKTVAELNAFELAWTFMGYSFGYILFIGLVEVIGAWLLLWERAKLLGVALLLPVMVNIIVFDVFFLDKYGALASASIYTALLLLILFLERERVAAVVRILTAPSPMERSSLAARTKTVIVVTAMAGALFGFDQLLTNLLGH